MVYIPINKTKVFIKESELPTKKHRLKFMNSIFRMYSSKPKIIFTWDDLCNLSDWVSSEHFEPSNAEADKPFLNSAIYYFESCVDLSNDGKQYHPCPKNRGKEPNMADAFILDVLNDGSYSFK